MRVLPVIGLPKHSGEDRSGGHARSDRRGDTGQKQRYGENDRRMTTEQRTQQRVGLLQFRNRSPRDEKRRGREQDHRAVDRPADEHRKDRIDVLVAQLPADRTLVAQIPFPALNHLGMQEQIVRHHDGPEHAHDDYHRAFGERRRHPCDRRRRPVDRHERQLVDERQPDSRDEGDDPLFDQPIAVRKKRDQHESEHQSRPDPDRNAEQHLQRDSSA